MSAAPIAKVECDCGELMAVKKNSGGGYSLHCGACKAIAWKKTPKAVAAFEKKHGIDPAGLECPPM